MYFLDNEFPGKRKQEYISLPENMQKDIPIDECYEKFYQ